MSKMEQRAEKLGEQLKSWGMKWDELASKAKSAKEENQVKLQEDLDHLKSRMALAKLKLKEFEAAGESRWEQFRGEIEKIWDEIGQIFKNWKS